LSPTRPITLRRLAGSIAALCAAFTLLVAAAPAKAETMLGFTEAANHNDLNAATQNRLLDLEAAAGGELHRLVLLWKDVEPYQVNGTPVQNWSYYDAVMSAASARGLRPVIVIMSAPAWAQQPLECGGAHCPPAQSKLSAWSRFVYDVTKRYPGAAAIEIWNEPNLWGQWATGTGPDPERYAQLFSHAAGAVHYADPSMKVLAGAITYQDVDVPQKKMTIPTFLERFYRAGGRNQMAPGDGLSLHAYPWIDELETLDNLFARTMRQTREALARFDPERKIWITETGATTTGRWAVSDRAQGKALVTLARKVPRMDDVRALMIHSTVEAAYNSNHPHEKGYGLVLRNTLQPKLGYCALAELAAASRALTGCPSGVLADLGYAADGSPLGGGGDGSAGGGGDGSGAGGGKGIDDRKAQLRRRGRRVCKRRLSRRPWWPQATVLERRAMVRICVRRFVRQRLS
jgi:hypothetical protein